MIENLLTYTTITLIVALPAVGVALGQGYAAQHMMDILDRQPNAHGEISRAAFLGIALMETAVVLSIVIAFLLVFDPTLSTSGFFECLARLGIALALAVPGFVVGLSSSRITMNAIEAVARQPFFGPKIINLLLVTQSLLQTPLIFCLLIAWFIKTQAPTVPSLTEAVRLVSSGLAIGLGCIGPLIGIARFSAQTMAALGTNRTVYGKLFTFTFMSLAIIETPVLFALVTSLILLFSTTLPTDSDVRMIVYVAGALSIGLGTLAPGINSGKIASAAATSIALEPDLYPVISRGSLLSQALIETLAIYASITSLLLILLIR